MYNKCLIIASIGITVLILAGCKNSVGNFTEVDESPEIFPDYTSIVLPANIAPLNFNINEKGEEYLVEIYSKKGKKIIIKQSSPKILIPTEKWHNLLDENKGNCLYFDVYAKRDKWYKYATFTDTIAHENIDNNLVYRTIGIVYTYYDKIGIIQRNLENFEKSSIYENTFNDKKMCLNCHSFCNNNPDKMSLHFRIDYAGTVIYDKGDLKKYNTKTKKTFSSGTYTAWHPDGKLIAYSVNRLVVNFTSFTDKIVEVWDTHSDITIFNTKTNSLVKPPKLSTRSRENLPCWSPDGKWLYFISAPEIREDETNLIDEKYSLLRIPFNAEDMSWGEIDTILSSKQTGKSITFPAVSPDGGYIVFCMIDHGYFSIFDKQSDLYILDLHTRQYQKLDILNSNVTDSYHSWSKNGRWLVFSSKRVDEVCSFPYFAYFDEKGNFHKPFILPQKDPQFYKEYTENFNLPVFVDEKININGKELRDFITKDALNVNLDTTSLGFDINAVSGASQLTNKPDSFVKY